MKKTKFREMLKEYKSEWLEAMYRLREAYTSGRGLAHCPLCEVGSKCAASVGLFCFTGCDACIWRYFTGEGCGRGYADAHALVSYDIHMRVGLSFCRKVPEVNRYWAKYRAKQLTAWIKNVKRWKV